MRGLAQGIKKPLPLAGKRRKKGSSYVAGGATKTPASLEAVRNTGSEGGVTFFEPGGRSAGSDFVGEPVVQRSRAAEGAFVVLLEVVGVATGQHEGGLGVDGVFEAEFAAPGQFIPEVREDVAEGAGDERLDIALRQVVGAREIEGLAVDLRVSFSPRFGERKAHIEVAHHRDVDRSDRSVGVDAAVVDVGVAEPELSIAFAEQATGLDRGGGSGFLREGRGAGDEGQREANFLSHC